MAVLAIGSHLDDIELGCFGTMLKYQSMGHDIDMLVCSDCQDLPRNHGQRMIDECNAIALKYIGQCPVRLSLPNTRLHEYGAEIRHALEEARDNTEYHLVICPWQSDINQDHKAVSDECIRVFREHNLIQYEVPRSTVGFAPNVYVSLTDEQVTNKLDAVGMYETQAHTPYFDRAHVLGQLQFRGLEIGTQYAESFWTRRLIL